ncbi:hypothetical protein [Caballeronia sp. KNU42]
MGEIDGGSAFPQSKGAGDLWVAEGGLSMRDYFAAKALAAMIGQPDKDPENRGAKGVPRLAQFAYEYADAMITARSA